MTAMSVHVTLGQLVAELGGTLIGDPGTVIQQIGPLDSDASHAIAFLSNPKYRAQLTTSKAACVIVSPAVQDEATARGAVPGSISSSTVGLRKVSGWLNHHAAAPAAHASSTRLKKRN